MQPLTMRGVLTNVAWVIAGAALGATARYLVGGWLTASIRGNFPWGTLAVNLIGCFVIGVLWGVGERAGWPAPMRTFLFVGILGSFTTFSSFGLETVDLLRGGEAATALTYVLVSNAAGLGLVWLGILTARPAGG